MKKLISLLLALTLAVSLIGCSAKEEKPAEPAEEVPAAEAPAVEPAPAEGESDGAVIGMPNPVENADPATILSELGIIMNVPMNAENVIYHIIRGENVIAEEVFSLNGIEYCYRMAPSAFGEEKIDGMYFQWENTAKASVSYLEAQLGWNEGGEGACVWFDVVPGMLYSLTVKNGASAENLSAVAAQLFVPLQGEVDGDPGAVAVEEPIAVGLGEAETEAFRLAIFDVLDDVRETCFPGTAGASLNAAACCARLCDLLTAYPDAAANDVMGQLESYMKGLDPDTRDLFSQQLSAVADIFPAVVAENGPALLEDAGYSREFPVWDTARLIAIKEQLTPAEDPVPVHDPRVAETAYSMIIGSYAAAKRDGWDRATLQLSGLNYMAVDSVVGTLVWDLDGDGVDELVVGCMDDNDFCRGLILDLYTLDGNGAPTLVLQSGERNRWYSLNDTIFRHEGSSGAADSFSVTEQYSAGAMTEIGNVEGAVVPMALTPVI